MTDRQSLPAMKILLTGGAGFIGSHIAERLLEDGHTVWVLDHFNDYYDPRVKRRNVEEMSRHPRFTLVEGDIRDRSLVNRLFEGAGFDAVMHLAALPGVRSSVKDPASYFDVNLNGTITLLEAARRTPGIRFIFGSSSSVYGIKNQLPFREDDVDIRPVSPYAASKRAGELVCYTYHHLYSMPMTCLRYFTVYGPRQRPEMAITRFTGKIFEGEALPLYGDGSARRDFTHVSDIVDGSLGALGLTEGYHIYNLGESRTITIMELIGMIARCVGKEARIDFRPEEAGDVPATMADISLAKKEIQYRPRTPLEEGVRGFVQWFERERTA